MSVNATNTARDEETVQVALTTITAEGLKSSPPTDDSKFFMTIEVDGSQLMQTAHAADPVWDLIDLTLKNTGNDNSTICLQVWESDVCGPSKLLGEAETNLSSILSHSSSDDLSIPIKSEKPVVGQGYLHLKIDRNKYKRLSPLTASGESAHQTNSEETSGSETSSSAPSHDEFDVKIDSATAELQSTSPQSPEYIQLMGTLADHLTTRFQQKGNARDLDMAIQYNSTILDMRPHGHPHRFAALGNFANSLLTRFRRYGDASDIKHSIQLLQEAVESLPPDHTAYPFVVQAYAAGLRARFTQYGDVQDLELAIQACNIALPVCPQERPVRGSLLQTRGNILVDRFDLQGDDDDLQLAIESYSAALELRPLGHPSRPSVLSGLADALQTRFNRGNDYKDLEMSEEYHSIAAYQCNPEHPGYPLILNGLSSVLLTSFMNGGDYNKLESAIQISTRAIQYSPEGNVSHTVILNNLANTIWVRFRHSGNAEDLDLSIEYYTQSLRFQDNRNPNYFSSLFNLGNALLVRFERRGQLKDLDLGIEQHEISLSLCQTGHPSRPTCLNGLGGALITCFKMRGDLSDLTQAILYLHEALAISELRSAVRNESALLLSDALVIRSSRGGGIEDLESAIRYCDEVLEHLPQTHITYHQILKTLAEALVGRYESKGDLVDLDLAIFWHRKVMELATARKAATASVSLANALLTHFNRQGIVKFLEEALELLRSSLEACPPEDSNRPTCLTNLGNALTARYQYYGILDDLELAIQYYTETVELHSPDHFDCSAWLCNLALGIFSRYQYRREKDDLTEAIVCLQKALDRFRFPEGPKYVVLLMNLGATLACRFEIDGNIDDINAAIGYHKTILEHLPEGSPFARDVLVDLSSALFHRYCSQSSRADLDLAITSAFASSQVTSMDHPDYAHTLVHLSEILTTPFERGATTDLELPKAAYTHLLQAENYMPSHHPRRMDIYLARANMHDLIFRYSGGPENVQYASEFYEKAARFPSASLYDRMRAVLKWIQAAERTSHASALTAYQVSFDLLDRFISATPSVSTRHNMLHSSPVSAIATYSADATSRAIRDGELKLAVEMSEHSRGLLWTQLARFRTPLEELRLSHETGKRLADEFERLSGQLQVRSVGHTVYSGTNSRMSLEEESRRYRRISKEWDDVVDQIRQIDGFNHFLMPTPISMLQEAASHGPVIIVNISKYRCDAIIVMSDSPPHLVCLPDVTIERLSDVASTLLEVLKNTSGIGEEKLRERTMMPLLRYLWTSVVQPVVEALKNKVSRGSRIWWCPTSKLSALPLHAAGPYRRGELNLSNIYVSSYTPTLSALIRSRRNTPDTRTFLAIGQALPNKSSQERELKSVGAELELVKSLVPPSMPFHQISGDQATSDGALQGLQEHSWTHLACHGRQDLAQPFDSSFDLRDNPLRLVDIIGKDVPHRQFAFLSACHTAAGDRNTPDEVIHLAAGMQFSGFRSVVGTLWAVDDRTVQRMVSEFYTHLFNAGIDCTNAANALNKATKTVNKAEVSLDQRIVFIHIGA